MSFSLQGTSPNAWIQQNSGTTDDDSTLAAFITTNSAALNGSSVISYTGPDGGVRRTFNINVVGAANGTDLTDSTGGIIFVQGTFNHNARLNNYIYGIAQNASTGTWVIDNGGTVNMTGTVQGTNRSLGSSSHLASFRGTFFGGANSFFKVNSGGTLNTNGVGYYANQAIVLAGRRNNTPTFGTRITRWTDNGSTIRQGTDATGTGMLIRSDVVDGASTYPGTIYNNRYVLNGTTFVDSTLSCAGAYDNINSSFTNLQFLRESTVPVGQRGATLVGIQLYAPQNLVGIDYGQYDTHFASVYNLETTAYRTTQYGFRTGLAPRIGKNGDRQVSNNWFELRKQLNLTFRNAANQVVPNVYTYFEDATPSFAGSLVQVNTQTFGTYVGTNGTFTSNPIAGGTGGTITATFVSGVFQGCTVNAGGSGYTADITGYAISVANFPTLTGVTTAATVTIYPAIRRAAGTAGQPNWTANNAYAGTSNASGLLSATNPTRPLGTNTGGTALTGVDVLLAGTNYTLTGLSATVTCQGLNQIDYRFNTGAYLTPSYSVTFPVRGYLFNDDTYTASLDGLTQNIDDTVILATDTYATATGITEATAAGFSDITLVATAPIRTTAVGGSTSGALIQSTTGTLTFGSSSRSLDQLYAKAKRDYVQPVLNTTAGVVARTGFGMASFLAPSGSTSNATLSLGAWAISAGTGVLTSGSVFKTLSTTGNVLMYGGQITTPNATNAPSIVANNILLGLAGTPASWRTNSTLGTGTGATTFTASIPTGLGLSATVTTGSVTITGTPATDAPLIQTALQNAVNSANINTQVSVNVVTGLQATITYTGTGYVSNGSSYGSTATFNVPNAAGTALVACTITPTGAVWGTQTAAMTAIAGALNANATFTGAGWTATSNATSVICTRTTAGVLTATNPTISGQNGNWTFNMPALTFGTLTFVNGTAGVNSLQATFTAPTPAVGGVVPTSALVLNSSLATYIVSTQAADQLVSSVAGVAGTTVYQSFTPTNTINNLPTSGLILGSGGALLSGSTNSNYTIVMGGIPANPMTFASGQDSIRTKNINATGGARSMQIAAMELYEGILNVTTDSNDFNISMVGDTIGPNNLVINQLGGAGRVIVTTSGNTGGTITAGTGNVTIQSALVVTFDATSNGGTVGIYNGATLLTSAQLSAATFPASQLISYGGSATHVTFTRAATQIVDTTFPATGTLTLSGLASTPAGDPTTPLANWSFLFNNTSLPGVYKGYLVVGADATSGFVTAQNIVALMGRLEFNRLVRLHPQLTKATLSLKSLVTRITDDVP